MPSSFSLRAEAYITPSPECNAANIVLDLSVVTLGDGKLDKEWGKMVVGLVGEGMVAREDIGKQELVEGLVEMLGKELVEVLEVEYVEEEILEVVEMGEVESLEEEVVMAGVLECFSMAEKNTNNNSKLGDLITSVSSTISPYYL
ncbi:hypothetical protein ACH5RR_029183 [Cinchona calisaya]|uniref:Uncharacterized protein n=1 Tax=Cinchona calisaya TaxID=153742 RepID=A0ABD2YU66_9GENT